MMINGLLNSLMNNAERDYNCLKTIVTLTHNKNCFHFFSLAFSQIIKQIFICTSLLLLHLPHIKNRERKTFCFTRSWLEVPWVMVIIITAMSPLYNRTQMVFILIGWLKIIYFNSYILHHALSFLLHSII